MRSILQNFNESMLVSHCFCSSLYLVMPFFHCMLYSMVIVILFTHRFVTHCWEYPSLRNSRYCSLCIDLISCQSEGFASPPNFLQSKVQNWKKNVDETPDVSKFGSSYQQILNLLCVYFCGIKPLFDIYLLDHDDWLSLCSVYCCHSQLYWLALSSGSTRLRACRLKIEDRTENSKCPSTSMYRKKQSSK